MLQLLYVSSHNPKAGPVDVPALLAVSRRNNGRDGVTGLLYADAKRFLQVLEGPEDKVEAAYARISADPRHHAIVLLSRRTIEAREFGDWAMARREGGDTHDAFAARVDALTADASPSVRGTFAGLIEIRRAA